MHGVTLVDNTSEKVRKVLGTDAQEVVMHSSGGVWEGMMVKYSDGFEYYIVEPNELQSVTEILHDAGHRHDGNVTVTL